MAMIYDPNRDCFVDVVTLEPRARRPGETIRPEWLGTIDLPGLITTKAALRQLVDPEMA